MNPERDRLVAKLSVELSNAINNEAQVLHILVCIRKLMDMDNNTRHPVLRLYCNWAVHTELSSTRQANIDLLQAFDKAAEDMANGKPPFAASDYIQYAAFKKYLFAFMTEYNLDAGSLKDESKWRVFRSCYMEIIADFPVTYKAGSLNLKNIESVSVDITKYPSISLEHEEYQKLKMLMWKVHLKSGQTVRCGVLEPEQAPPSSPNSPQMS